MASPPIPPLLLQRPSRSFSFYPPLIGVQHNEWLFRKATWQEFMVVNGKTGLEVSIPRRFVGEVSRTGDPVLIVGLIRELQYKDDAVVPFRKRVIEMPLAADDRGAIQPLPGRQKTLAPVIGIRLESRRDRRAYKVVGGAMAASIFLYVATANIAHLVDPRQRATSLRHHSYLALRSGDSYEAIIHKLGIPASDRWFAANGISYRALGYGAFTVVLKAGTNGRPGYVGAVDRSSRPLDGSPVSPQIGQ